MFASCEETARHIGKHNNNSVAGTIVSRCYWNISASFVPSSTYHISFSDRDQKGMVKSIMPLTLAIRKYKRPHRVRTWTCDNRALRNGNAVKTKSWTCHLTRSRYLCRAFLDMVPGFRIPHPKWHGIPNYRYSFVSLVPPKEQHASTGNREEGKRGAARQKRAECYNIPRKASPFDIAWYTLNIFMEYIYWIKSTSYTGDALAAQ